MLSCSALYFVSAHVIRTYIRLSRLCSGYAFLTETASLAEGVVVATSSDVLHTCVRQQAALITGTILFLGGFAVK